MFSFRIRFRSPSRDRETDRLRVGAVRDAVQVAITSATHELEGVRKRLGRSRDEAACLVGTEVFGDDREPEDEKALVKAEEGYLSAQQRIANLTVQIEKLKLIKNLLEDSFPAGSAKLGS
jgi:hypothetical protein